MGTKESKPTTEAEDGKDNQVVQIINQQNQLLDAHDYNQMLILLSGVEVVNQVKLLARPA